MLSSILGREGIDVEDVLAVSIEDDGATEIVVLGGAGDEADGGGLLGEGGLARLTDAELADLDVELLSDEELAEVDLALLPEEEQRVGAVLRLLSRSRPAQGDAEGTTRIVDLGVLLGEDSLAIVDDALGDVAPEVDAELVAQLEALGVDPEAVVAVATDAGGNERVFIDTSLLLGGSGTGTGTGRTGGGSGGTGDTGDTDGSSGGTDSETGTDVGSGSGDGTGGSDGGNGAGAGIADADGVNGAAAAGGAGLELFATLDCDVGGAALSQGTSASPSAVAQASSLELVRVVGCDQSLASDDIERVRDALESNAAITETIDSLGLSLEQVIGATVSDEVVTVFIEQPVA